MVASSLKWLKWLKWLIERNGCLRRRAAPVARIKLLVGGRGPLRLRPLLHALPVLRGGPEPVGVVVIVGIRFRPEVRRRRLMAPRSHFLAIGLELGSRRWPYQFGRNAGLGRRRLRNRRLVKQGQHYSQCHY